MYDWMTEAREICLRPYQKEAVQALRDAIREGKKRMVLCAGTGAGKTVIASHLLREAKRKGSYALFMVDRVSLVQQTSATLDSYGIAHGVLQGIHPRYDPHEDVQVCSIQTLARRILPRKPSLIIYDECHAQYGSTLAYMADNPQAVKIGLTATPFTKGMGQHWDGVVNVIPTRALIDSGFLIEPTIYVARSPDDSQLGRNKFGEFSDKSASDAGIQIIGDVVAEWIGKTTEHFGGPVKTIVFSPTVEHGCELVQAFNAAGYRFEQVSYLDRSDEERAAKIEEFRKPDSAIHGLISCGVLTKGFDVPDVRCGISCKPYRKSLSSHMQEIGRVMRSHPGKDKALWLCHSGNIERFAVEAFDVWDNGCGPLDVAEKRDSKPRERSEAERETAVCPECSGAMRGPTCMACGYERPAKSDVQHVNGELQEFSREASGPKPRDGLRAECLQHPRKIWEAALAYTTATTRKGEQHARKWAYGIYAGVYPGSKLPRGWFDAPVPLTTDPNASALVEREVKRFRKRARK